MFVNFFINKGFLTIVPIEKTFFTSVDFTSHAKLSYESVLFNYQNLSPYKNSSVSYIQKDDKLLLWFYDKSYRHVFTVPEGFLYYHFFNRQEQNTLVNIQEKVTLVIEKENLSYQSTCIEPTSQEKQLLSKKYHVENIIEKSAKWNISYKKKIRNRPIFTLAKYFIDKKLFIDMLKENFLGLIIPTFAFLIFITLLHVGIQQYLQKELSIYSDQKSEIKEKIKDIFSGIQINNRDILFLKTTMQKYSSLDTETLSEIARVVKKEDGHIYYLTYNKKFMTIRMTCPQIESFLDSLSKIKQIKSYKLNKQMKTKDATNDITLEISLKGDLI